MVKNKLSTCDNELNRVLLRLACANIFANGYQDNHITMFVTYREFET